MNKEQFAMVKRNAAKLRSYVVRMIGPNKRGHYGGSLSCADLISALYFYKMHYNPLDTQDPKRDRLILSKGHAVFTQYAALCLLGIIPEDVLLSAKNIGSPIQGHPDMKKQPCLLYTSDAADD